MELPPATGVDLSRADDAADQATGSARVERRQDLVRVVLAGEIDIEMKDELFDALQEAARDGQPVEVDCGAVTFIDSTGISGLAWLANLTSEPPCLVGVPPVMYELLQLTGMDHVFRFAT
ncbi:MAG: STAS domain-containing protein [Actinotalea sp.]|nr:STAS domain-containing protein [Actinotalea sp.]